MLQFARAAAKSAGKPKPPAASRAFGEVQPRCHFAMNGEAEAHTSCTWGHLNLAPPPSPFQIIFLPWPLQSNHLAWLLVQRLSLTPLTLQTVESRAKPGANFPRAVTDAHSAKLQNASRHPQQHKEMLIRSLNLTQEKLHKEK